MASLQLDHSSKMRQHSRFTQVIAVALAVVPIYGFAIWSHLTKDRPYSTGEMMFYPLVFGGGSILLILLLLRFVCGEKLSSLNLKAGKWWRDMVSGLLLFVVLILSSFFSAVHVGALVSQRACARDSDPPSGLERAAVAYDPMAWAGVVDRCSRV